MKRGYLVNMTTDRVLPVVWPEGDESFWSMVHSLVDNGYKVEADQSRPNGWFIRFWKTGREDEIC